MGKKRRVHLGINDLASCRPDIATQWHPSLNEDLTPQMVSVCSQEDAWWQTDCFNDGVFHIWHCIIGDRTRIKRFSNCAICHGKQVQIGINDLSSKRPDITSEWHPILNGELTPEMVTTGSDKDVWWWKDCENNRVFHQWHSTVIIRTRTMKPQGCAVCSSHQVQIGVIDILPS